MRTIGDPPPKAETSQGRAARLNGQPAILRALRAVRRGDFSVRLSTDGDRMDADIARAFNDVVELNEATARELRRLNRAVGREGRISQRASIRDAEGEWARTVESLNELIDQLAEPAVQVSRMLGAVAKGDLSQRMSLEIEGRPLSGEFRRWAETVNTMVDQLNAFASEVTRVAREVGTEGKLGGQADVRGVGGTWKDLTDKVNLLAANLTTQVRAIGEVATAVTRGDLSREVLVEARGEVEQLKDNVNEMIRRLRDTTRENADQVWLKTNLARFGSLLQGQRDLEKAGGLILSELAPLVGGLRGVFYLRHDDGTTPYLSLLASYAHEPGTSPPQRLDFGEGLIGQVARERQKLVITQVPDGYAKIKSALGEALPRTLLVIPVLYEGETRAVIEIAALDEFSDIQLSFIEQLSESIGMVLNAIAAGRKAEELVQEQAARAAAEAGLARLRQIVDVMPEGILIADATGSVYLHNVAAVEIMGEVPSTAVLAAVRRLDGSACPPEEQPLARAVYRGEVVRGEQLMLTNPITQREIPILFNSAPLSDTKGIAAGGVAVFQDITPLHDLDRQRDQFLAAVSHDLRTPMAVIKGRTNLLQRALGRADPPNLEEVAKGLQTIDDSTARLVRLVDELLDLTRLRMGHVVEFEFRRTDLLEICSRLVGEYQKMSPDNQIVIRSELDGLVGSWDEARMERVVGNLLSNAVKYSAKGSEIEISAWEETRDGDPWAGLSVTNSGMGIPSAELQRVFEPYYRGSNVTGSISGTGVGLAGTRHIVEQHGGEITVESVVGETTTFTVRLPLHPEPVARPTA